MDARDLISEEVKLCFAFFPTICTKSSNLSYESRLLAFWNIIKLLFQKAKSLDSYDKLDDLVQIVGKNAKHNLTSSEIIIVNIL
jgi:hypothetical protein